VASKVGREGGIIGANVLAIEHVLDAGTIDSMVEESLER
jgi:hypothetical protein